MCSTAWDESVSVELRNMASLQSGDPWGAIAPQPGSTVPGRSIAPDCAHYHGDRPCIHNRLCTGCTHYETHPQRLCVIKLGAVGDVIRTLCILPELRRRYPQAHLTWVSRAGGARMIQHHPQIDRVLAFDALTSMVLAQERFDLAINLDKDTEPCALVMSLSAAHRLGVGLSPYGTPVPLNDQAAHYMHLGLSDAMKFKHNTRSYPRLIHEALGWSYSGQRYHLPVRADAVRHLRQQLESRGWDPARPTVGLNVGAADRFANKMWPAERIVALIVALHAARPGTQMILLGGHHERPTIAQITAGLTHAGLAGTALDGGTDHDEQHFLALVDTCDLVFSGDTMALHAAVARAKPVVAWFGPTCHQEIDLFGRGRKLIAEVPCAPCYRRACDQGDVCVSAVPVRTVVAAIEQELDQLPARTGIVSPAPRQVG